MEALTRAVGGQPCRQRTFSPMFHLSELCHTAAPDCKDTGTCNLPGRAQQAEEEHAHWGALALSVTPLPLRTWLQTCMVRGAVGKKQQGGWVSFLNGNTEYFYVSILFKVILWIYNFNVQIRSSNGNN